VVARGWLDLSAVGIREVALIIFLAWWLGKNQRQSDEFLRGLAWPLAGVLPILVLMIVQKDLGTTAIMLAIVVTMLFCAGVRLIYLLPGFARRAGKHRGGVAVHAGGAWGAGWRSFIRHLDHSLARCEEMAAATGPDRARLRRIDRTGLGQQPGRRCIGCPR